MAEPLMRHARGLGRRLLAGLAVGTAVSSTLVGALVAGAHRLITAAPGSGARPWVLAAVVVALAGADATGHTPQRRRQVPQAYLHGARSRLGLGLVWGADLGLLVTTRKTTSMGWVALAGAAPLGPAAVAVAVPVVFGLAYVGVVAAVARWPRLGAGPLVFGLASADRVQRVTGAASGLVLLGGGALVLVAGRV